MWRVCAPPTRAEGLQGLQGLLGPSRDGLWLLGDRLQRKRPGTVNWRPPIRGLRFPQGGGAQDPGFWTDDPGGLPGGGETWGRVVVVLSSCNPRPTPPDTHSRLVPARLHAGAEAACARPAIDAPLAAPRTPDGGAIGPTDEHTDAGTDAWRVRPIRRGGWTGEAGLAPPRGGARSSAPARRPGPKAGDAAGRGICCRDAEAAGSGAPSRVPEGKGGHWLRALAAAQGLSGRRDLSARRPYAPTPHARRPLGTEVPAPLGSPHRRAR
ncbi:hypothetical protein P7K49_033620 [Saguinus oedipus]|uniref:Uncharacterized protein n=1 Tax=Saguinus oedipus TaxID=9490 RepID=A0ABQ9TTH4_SAGOE|nr:hypothetical protein P7K49_033620 [Saguinus oedipus]